MRLVLPLPACYVSTLCPLPSSPVGIMNADDRTRRWRIDALEDGIAAIEEAGEPLRYLPRWILPPDAREDDILAVHFENSAEGETILRIRIDREATARALERSIQQIRSIPPQNDPGGDIHL